MYQNQAFSSGSYEEILSGAPLLPNNYNDESVGSQNNEFKFISSIGETLTMHHHHQHQINDHSNNADPSCNSFSAGSDSNVVVSRTQQIGLIETDQNIQCQGLSLSLGTVMPSIGSVPQFQYHYPNTISFSSLMNATMQNLKENSPLKDENETNLHKELRNSAECMASMSFGGFYNTMKREGLYNNSAQHPSMCLNEGLSDLYLQGSAGFSNPAENSQYLKAAQELLDEMVNVRKALKQPVLEKHKRFHENGLDRLKDSDGKCTNQSMQVSSGPNGTSTAFSSSELSPAERHSLLDKKTKLLAMLDEVDKRYRQYCHQMQIVVSSFNMVAGIGSAEPYTNLAWRMISRHFRCLRDAISSQIQETQRILGEQEGIPRLRYVDQKLRHQKELQKLGMLRQTWRPQRGLPENSVSILRAWLFEHFLNPYPKDSEKIMLARQTGLTRSQVANWFINARVRLWKPMVEEMYKEEFGDSEVSFNILSENGTPKASRDDVQVSDNLVNVESNDHGENVMNSSMSRKFQGDEQMKFNMNNNNYSNHASIQIDHNGDDGCLMASNMAAYDLTELGNFAVESHVSLVLELRNRDSNESGMSNDDTLPASSPETNLLDYHLNDSGKQQHKFGNAHMLHEFVV